MAFGDIIARLAVQLQMDTVAFEKGATLAEKRLESNRKKLESIGNKMAGIGGKISLAIGAPLAALGVASYKAAQESADALGQVETALKSMGDASGRTVQQLQALASSQMSKSLYDDDEILRSVTANLLTFGNISGKAFDQAQQAAIDLSARLGTDLQSSTILVGKALNDPIKGLTALTRVGVAFTGQQKEQIKAMVEAGNTAGAQAIILQELQREYGGAAAAARAADPTAASKQAWNDFQETIGKFVIEVLPTLTSLLTKVLEGFNNLSPGMQKVIVAAGAIAIALGPVLIAFGSLLPLVTALPALIGAVGTALAFIAANPVILGLAAVVFGIYEAWKHWDQIKVILHNLYTAAKSFLIDKLVPVLNAVLNPIDTVAKAFHTLYDKVVGHSYVPDMVDGIAAQMARLDAVMVNPAKEATSKAAQAFRDMQQNVSGLLDQLFPEIAAKNAYEKNRADLIAVLGQDASLPARTRLADQYDRSKPALPALDFGTQPLVPAMDDLEKALDHLTSHANDNTVRIAKSFKDMANDTLNSLQNLTNAIKGGGFLNILQSVANFAIQLGSIGAFGKSIQTSINSTVPKYATGTNFHPGGLALVGERGPELVSMPRGSRVTPNNKLGGGNSYYFNGNLMTPEFWARIQAGDFAAANAGASGGVAKMQYGQTRRVG